MLSDVMGNQVPCAMGTMSTLAPQIKAGTVKALAVLSPDRIEDFPQIPTFVELGYPREFGWRGGFIGFFGPANLPDDVANVLAGAFNKMLADPIMQRAMKLNFVVGKPTVLQDAAKEVVTTRDAWGDLVTRLHLAAN
jgi:tripartite-type tricarboxylate transporter receptor subunit TctC